MDAPPEFRVAVNSIKAIFAFVHNIFEEEDISLLKDEKQSSVLNILDAIKNVDSTSTPSKGDFTNYDIHMRYIFDPPISTHVSHNNQTLKTLLLNYENCMKESTDLDKLFHYSAHLLEYMLPKCFTLSSITLPLNNRTSIWSRILESMITSIPTTSILSSFVARLLGRISLLPPNSCEIGLLKLISLMISWFRHRFQPVEEIHESMVLSHVEIDECMRTLLILVVSAVMDDMKFSKENLFSIQKNVTHLIETILVRSAYISFRKAQLMMDNFCAPKERNQTVFRTPDKLNVIHQLLTPNPNSSILNTPSIDINEFGLAPGVTIMTTPRSKNFNQIKFGKNELEVNTEVKTSQNLISASTSNSVKKKSSAALQGLTPRKSRRTKIKPGSVIKTENESTIPYNVETPSNSVSKPNVPTRLLLGELFDSLRIQTEPSKEGCFSSPKSKFDVREKTKPLFSIFFTGESFLINKNEQNKVSSLTEKKNLNPSVCPLSYFPWLKKLIAHSSTILEAFSRLSFLTALTDHESLSSIRIILEIANTKQENLLLNQLFIFNSQLSGKNCVSGIRPVNDLQTLMTDFMLDEDDPSLFDRHLTSCSPTYVKSEENTTSNLSHKLPLSTPSRTSLVQFSPQLKSDRKKAIEALPIALRSSHKESSLLSQPSDIVKDTTTSNAISDAEEEKRNQDDIFSPIQEAFQRRRDKQILKASLTKKVNTTADPDLNLHLKPQAKRLVQNTASSAVGSESIDRVKKERLKDLGWDDLDDFIDLEVEDPALALMDYGNLSSGQQHHYKLQDSQNIDRLHSSQQSQKQNHVQSVNNHNQDNHYTERLYSSQADHDLTGGFDPEIASSTSSSLHSPSSRSASGRQKYQLIKNSQVKSTSKKNKNRSPCLSSSSLSSPSQSNEDEVLCLPSIPPKRVKAAASALQPENENMLLQRLRQAREELTQRNQLLGGKDFIEQQFEEDDCSVSSFSVGSCWTSDDEDDEIASQIEEETTDHAELLLARQHNQNHAIVQRKGGHSLHHLHPWAEDENEEAEFYGDSNLMHLRLSSRPPRRQVLHDDMEDVVQTRRIVVRREIPTRQVVEEVHEIPVSSRRMNTSPSTLSPPRRAHVSSTLLVSPEPTRELKDRFGSGINRSLRLLSSSPRVLDRSLTPLKRPLMINDDDDDRSANYQETWKRRRRLSSGTYESPPRPNFRSSVITTPVSSSKKERLYSSNHVFSSLSSNNNNNSHHYMDNRPNHYFHHRRNSISNSAQSQGGGAACLRPELRQLIEGLVSTPGRRRLRTFAGAEGDGLELEIENLHS